jgi:hypothetical protein
MDFGLWKGILPNYREFWRKPARRPPRGAGGFWREFIGLVCLLRRRGLGQSGLVTFEPAFEDRDGGGEVVAEYHQQVDVVEIGVAMEAVSEVVAWVDHGLHFVAVRALEAEATFTSFPAGTVTAQARDGHRHGQIVANSP